MPRARCIDAGAAFVDVGGESTRPGAEAVTLDEELRRVVPVLEELAGSPISVDTSRAEVARRAIGLGATSWSTTSPPCDATLSSRVSSRTRAPRSA